MITTFLLAYVAGIVTLLSPCVLPLLPIILYGVLNEHRYGPLLLSIGLVSSFTLFGFILATIGQSIGLDQDLLRQIAGGILIFFGVILLFAPLYQKFSAGASNLTAGLNQLVSQSTFSGLYGQFFLGFVLGLVWAPCVGPTLGAAISLASQGENLTTAFFTMLVFAIGTITPLLLLSRLSRPSILKWKSRLASSSHTIKYVMAIIFIFVGFLFVTGLVLDFEEAVLDALPLWFIQFITKF